MAFIAKGDETFFEIAPLEDFAAECDEPGDLWSFRIVGIASYRAGALADKAADRNLGPNEAEVVLRCQNS